MGIIGRRFVSDFSFEVSIDLPALIFPHQISRRERDSFSDAAFKRFGTEGFG
jgi:hypothetical protein